MRGHLLDSNILMDFFKKKREAILLLEQLMEKGRVSASILSVTELRAGWTDGESLFLLPRFYKLVRIEPLTKDIAELAGKYRHEYKLKGITLPVIDTLIAATAVVGNYQLVTRNTKDFPMPELNLYTKRD